MAPWRWCDLPKGYPEISLGSTTGHRCARTSVYRSARSEASGKKCGLLRASADLDLEQLRKGAAPLEKFGPPPHLHDPTLVHDDDAIRLARTAQAVGR
jgi:hypothetical protein